MKKILIFTMGLLAGIILLGAVENKNNQYEIKNALVRESVNQGTSLTLTEEIQKISCGFNSGISVSYNSSESINDGDNIGSSLSRGVTSSYNEILGTNQGMSLGNSYSLGE